MIYKTNRLKNISVRAVAISLVIAITASYTPFSIVSVPKAHAQFGGLSFEINPAVVAGVVATGASTVTQTVILNALNGLAWTVAKLTIQSLTRSTVNWINSGFSGSPSFVSDLRSNLQYLGDAIADDFINNLNNTVVSATGFDIKSPFQDQISQKLREEYYRTTSSWGLNYTLDQQSKDPKAFLNGDFNQGGISAFLSASQNPANNPFGAYQLASNQLFAQIDSAAQQRKAELGWGKGFLPWRGSCNKSTSGGDASVALSKTEKCLFNAVRTPGSVIESQLENSLGSGIRQLELADSINEIVGALLGQLVNQVLGAGGLLGASQPSAGGGRSPLEAATSPTQYDAVNSSLASGVIQNIKNDETNVSSFRDNWQKILSAATNAQTTCGVRPDVSAVIDQATAGVAKGDAALTKIASIKSEVEGASQSTSVSKGTVITSALANYQSYLSSPEIPNASEIAEAGIQSQDTSGSKNLYDKMITLSKNCGVTSSNGT